MFLTVSFDIFLTFNLFGFTFRFSQVVSFILMIVMAAKCLKTGILIKSLGFGAFMIWFFFLMFATFNTPLVKMNFVYHLWLMFDFVIVLVMVNLFGEKERFNKVLKLYLLSFVIMAIVGLVQFILPVLGFPPLFVKQWWIRDVLPRINGFSYEPSYYATYMLIGWVIFRILFKYRKDYFKEYDRDILISFILITSAMIISSSRMGILMIAVFEMLNLGRKILKVMRTTRLTKRAIRNFGYGAIGFAILILIIVIINNYFYDLTFLLQGTGLFGTANHSFAERFKGMIDTFTVFTKSPIIGYGLGGVYTEVAALNGFDIYSVAVQDVGSVLNVFLETLAATGLIGFIFFVKYIYTLISKPIKLILPKIDSSKKVIMLALVLSLIFELFILMFNQNILRMYLWINIAMVSLCFYNFKKNIGHS